MYDDTATVLDRGHHANAKTPWDEESWRTAALDWAHRELTARGLRPTGRRGVRLRPWSVLVRIAVGDLGEGPGATTAVWLKANPPASAFEAPLTAALARWVPEYVLHPLAIDADRGWSLLPDGGELFWQVLDRTPADPHAWEEPLRQYATMQRALVPHTEALEQLGVPSARTTALPQVFDETVEFIESVTKTTAPLRQRVPAADPAPFCSFLVPAGRITERYGPEALPRLRDAYLEPWTRTGLTSKEVRRALTLAGRLGVIGRAVSWGRHFPGASDETRAAGAAASAEWLLELARDEPPF
ncbi:aminoglycoside phosphotransferase family protein [Streptomyces sp. NPDC088196]|uniref:aminoglycoside phosphotransferase family protein n=1 Tax=Streptomyces sp. NPDC088196 TaxID=3154868 RepID=UPI00344C1E74